MVEKDRKKNDMNYQVCCPHCGKPIFQCCPLCCLEKPAENPCPQSGICNRAYGEYSMASLNGPTNSYVTLHPLLQAGNLVRQSSDTALTLASGYVYYVSFLALATPETNGFFQLVPWLDEEVQLRLATFSPANAQWRNASTSGSFLIDRTLEEETVLRLQLSYSEQTRNIDLSGSLSIFPVAVGKTGRTAL